MWLSTLYPSVYYCINASCHYITWQSFYLSLIWPLFDPYFRRTYDTKIFNVPFSISSHSIDVFVLHPHFTTLWHSAVLTSRTVARLDGANSLSVFTFVLQFMDHGTPEEILKTYSSLMVKFWIAQNVELQKSFPMMPNLNQFPGNWTSKIHFLTFAWAFE